MSLMPFSNTTQDFISRQFQNPQTFLRGARIILAGSVIISSLLLEKSRRTLEDAEKTRKIVQKNLDDAQDIVNETDRRLKIIKSYQYGIERQEEENNQ
jgi:hypothetical protein